MTLTRSRRPSSNQEKRFDEDGYLSPLQIKAEMTTSSANERSTSSRPLHRSVSQCTCPHSYVPPPPPPPPSLDKRQPSTTFVSEFQKSLSIVDYIDLDAFDDKSASKDSDDALTSIKYLFNRSDPSARLHHQNSLHRRLPRRPTNTSSISADSGYYDTSQSSSKCPPIQMISCTLMPVNLQASNCPPPSVVSSSIDRRNHREYLQEKSLHRPIIMGQRDWIPQRTPLITMKNQENEIFSPPKIQVNRYERERERNSTITRVRL